MLYPQRADKLKRIQQIRSTILAQRWTGRSVFQPFHGINFGDPFCQRINSRQIDDGRDAVMFEVQSIICLLYTSDAADDN